MDRKKLMAVVGVLTSIALVGGAFAYFSGRAETKENKFAIVAGEQDQDGAIEIKEPNWVPPTDPVQPGQVLAKDPYVESKVDYEGYIVMKVTSPKISAKMSKEDTKFSKIEAFGYDWNTTDFQLLSEDDGTDAVVYYYGLKNSVAGKATTPKLFNKITFKNFAAVEKVDNMNYQVDVDAAIIQKIDPDKGTQFANVDAAFTGMGRSFEGYKATE